MLSQRTRLLSFMLGLGDLALTILAFWLAYWLRFKTGFMPHSNPDHQQYLIVLGGVLPLWPGLFVFFGLYESRRHLNVFSDFRPLALSISVGVIFISAFTFFYREISYSRFTFLLFGILNFAFLYGERILLRLYLQHARKRGYYLRRLLIVGAGALGLRVAQRALKHPEMGYQIAGFLDDFNLNDAYRKEYGIEVLGKLGALSEVIEKHHIDKVIVALPMRALRKIEQVVQACEKEGVETAIVPDFFKFIQPRTRVFDFAGLPLVSVRATPVDSWKYRRGKRCFDIIFSTAALILLSPLFLIIAVLVKLTSRGPVFFEQERIGTSRRPFYIYKFRSMSAGAEKHDHQAGLGLKNDPRVTRLGGFLRRWSLDELPQFWNVLRGDMSIVGPRPERTFQVRQFKSDVPNYMIRHQVKTGITGWAQVNGLRGNTSIASRIEHDLFYIENWSFWLDLRIILMTLTHGLVHEEI